VCAVPHSKDLRFTPISSTRTVRFPTHGVPFPGIVRTRAPRYGGLDPLHPRPGANALDIRTRYSNSGAVCPHTRSASTYAGVKAAEPQLKEQMAKAEQFKKAFQENLAKEMEQVMKNNQAQGSSSKTPSNSHRL
jgi:hypothetical protein